MLHPLGQLRILKTAITDVSRHIADQPSTCTPESDEDKLSVTMRLLRGVALESVGAINKATSVYPHLCTLVENPYSPKLLLNDALQPVRSHAVELAKGNALHAMTELKNQAPT